MVRPISAKNAKYDKYHSASSFEVDEQVQLSAQHLGICGVYKLLPRWIGPFRIIEKVDTLSYRLELPKIYNQLHPAFHISKLKSFVPNGIKEQDQTPPIFAHKGLEYKLESILAQRGCGRNTRYLVCWVGYGPEYNLQLSADDLEYVLLVLSSCNTCQNCKVLKRLSDLRQSMSLQRQSPGAAEELRVKRAAREQRKDFARANSYKELLMHAKHAPPDSTFLE